MKVLILLALVASSSAIWPFNSNQEPQGSQENQNNGGILRTLGNIINPVSGTVDSLIQDILTSLKGIIEEVSSLLGNSINNIKGLVVQLLNDNVPLQLKQQIIQNVLKNIQEPAKAKAQQVTNSLLTVSNQLKNQTPIVLTAVSDILSLAFDQKFIQLPAKQQQDQLEKITKGLKQEDLQTVANVLKTFKSEISVKNPTPANH